MSDENTAESNAEGSVTTDGKKIRGKNVFKIAGALIGFMIGAGFATGQETLQYYTSEGLWGVAGVVIAYAFCFFLFWCFMSTGASTKMTHSKDVFRYYCGKYLGMVYEVFTLIMLFLVTITMVAGAGSIFAQYFGLNDAIGRLIMCVLILLSVLLGLRKLLDVLGPIGPIVVIGLIIVALVALFSNLDGLSTASEFIKNADPKILTASKFWWLSGILYGIMNVYPLASFGSAMGAGATSKKEAVLGALIGAAALAAGAICVTLSQLANIDIVYNQDIPTLALVVEYMPAISIVFSIVLLLGIYTTVVPNMWAFAQAFGEDKSKRYIIAVIVAVAVIYAASFLPYGPLLNFIYPFAGYGAYLMIICMIIKHIRVAIEKKKGPKAEKKDTAA